LRAGKLKLNDFIQAGITSIDWFIAAKARPTDHEVLPLLFHLGQSRFYREASTI
jgi:hypothetical protein